MDRRFPPGWGKGGKPPQLLELRRLWSLGLYGLLGYSLDTVKAAPASLPSHRYQPLTPAPPAKASISRARTAVIDALSLRIDRMPIPSFRLLPALHHFTNHQKVPSSERK
jgi:hypothetical protein